MSDLNEKNTVNELAAVAHVVDFMVYLVKTISEHLDMLCKNMESLPGTFSTTGIAMLVDEVMDSMNELAGLIIRILPSDKKGCEDKYKEFWNLHTVLMSYHYDALMLIRHSLLSALIGYYSVAFSELRSAMESIVRGAVFDLLAIPEYRKETTELQKIKGFKGDEGFLELLKLLEKKLGDRRPNLSIEIFGIMDEELKNFNPRASFIGLLKQLMMWGIIDDELFREATEYYTELSKHTHRVHPRFSEIGSRIVTDRDWIELEPVPEELFSYLYSFANLNGLFTYLVLKVLSIDLVHEEYKNCIDREKLKEDIRRISKMAREYKTWKKTRELLKKLMMQ
ncbi:MAG: hypothetical protein DRJ47_01655 [Thermoprotei archaeon]|nr:MAG: hypothetical protein DRJ47_01655 [Thermoprotei archaeon]